MVEGSSGDGAPGPGDVDGADLFDDAFDAVVAAAALPTGAARGGDARDIGRPGRDGGSDGAVVDVLAVTHDHESKIISSSKVNAIGDGKKCLRPR